MECNANEKYEMRHEREVRMFQHESSLWRTVETEWRGENTQENFLELWHNTGLRRKWAHLVPSKSYKHVHTSRYSFMKFQSSYKEYPKKFQNVKEIITKCTECYYHQNFHQQFGCKKTVKQYIQNLKVIHVRGQSKTVSGIQGLKIYLSVISTKEYAPAKWKINFIFKNFNGYLGGTSVFCYVNEFIMLKSEILITRIVYTVPER